MQSVHTPQIEGTDMHDYKDITYLPRLLVPHRTSQIYVLSLFPHVHRTSSIPFYLAS